MSNLWIQHWPNYPEIPKGTLSSVDYRTAGQLREECQKNCRTIYCQECHTLSIAVHVYRRLNQCGNCKSHKLICLEHAVSPYVSLARGWHFLLDEPAIYLTDPRKKS
jgi:hypothetical protein